MEEQNMGQLKTIRKKENWNEGYIYLYCLDNKWKAFGRSAYYLTLLYPSLEVMKGDGHGVTGMFVFIPDDLLMELFEEQQAIVGNEYIEMKVPEKIHCNDEEFHRWCSELFDAVAHE